MKKEEMFESKDGKCPYCNSDDVMYIGSTGAGASSSAKLPEASIKDWRCNNCNKIFSYQGD